MYAITVEGKFATPTLVPQLPFREQQPFHVPHATFAASWEEPVTYTYMVQLLLLVHNGSHSAMVLLVRNGALDVPTRLSPL